MIKTRKNTELNELKEAIRQKRELIKQEQQKLEKLENKFRNKDMENNSEYPILLFLVDQTPPMWDDTQDWERAFIYYFPDYDATKCIIRHRVDELLPNTIDMRESFKSLGMPERVFPGDAYHDYYDIVQKAVAILQPVAKACFEIKEPIHENVEASNEEEDYKTSLPTPQMRLYSFLGYVNKAFFDTEDELTEYIGSHDTRFGDISKVEFLGNALGQTDVIRIIYKDGRNEILTVINQNSYAIYNPNSTWEYRHGNLRAIYQAFRDRDVTFTDDIYAKADEKRFSIKPKDNND